MNNKRELLIVQDEQRDWKKGEHEIWRKRQTTRLG